MKALFLLLLTLVSAGGISSGFFLFLRPSSAIELQKKFYEKINWRIEPVSMSKEIRNTRIMGLFLVFAALATIAVLLLAVLAPAGHAAMDKKTEKTGIPARVVVYDDEGRSFSPSGWMGNLGDVQSDYKCTTEPRSGKYCQRIKYNATDKKGWVVLFWQYPPNNWGDFKGQDLRGYKKLTFWVRGDSGGEVIGIKVGGTSGRKIRDSVDIEYGKINLTPSWKKYTVDLHKADLSNVIDGFCWSVNSGDNPKGCVFYLDDIAYEK